MSDVVWWLAFLAVAVIVVTAFVEITAYLRSKR